MSKLVLAMLFSATSNASTMINIAGGVCGSYISAQFGLTISGICVDAGQAYMCQENIQPFGSRLPKKFFSDFNIDADNPVQSIRKVCAEKNSQPDVGTAAVGCSLSDHALFKSLIARVGLPGHSCFCTLNDRTIRPLSRLGLTTNLDKFEPARSNIRV